MNTDKLFARLFDAQPLFRGSRTSALASIGGVEEEVILDGEDPENLTGSDYMGLFTAEEMTALFNELPVE
jgi:hypothetical protein